MDKKIKKGNIIQVRDDFYVNIDKIDCIIYTNTKPDGECLGNTYFYTMFFHNSKYNWITIPKEYFENNVKQYL